MTSIADIKLQLQTRRNNWDQQQQQISQLQEQASQLSQSIEKLHVQLAGLHQQLTHTNAELITQQELYSSLQAQRYALFGDKNTQREDQALRIKQEQLEQAVHQLQQEYHSCKQQLNTAHKLIENYQDQLKPVAQELHNLEDEFKDAMAKFGFGDEAEFSKALLPAEYLAELFQQREAQHTQGIELTAEFTRLNTKLITEQNKQLTTASQDQLNQNLEELNAALEANNQTIGSIRTKLQTNQQACNQQIAIIDEIAQQQLNAQRWQQLHALIGSADGKKFRNFAQGLTFELVVRNANSQLQTMSDRYLLVRDQEAPLELNVIDNYQGGEIRTTKNLSGGESFVISLALALGLSKLSSSKVQVDSLFLDEGFGSLDEDSLQTALDALAGLQQEGKLIGVISHVGALKDRISLQIQVEPLTGGVSRISGCGCAKLS
jgi:exonuclease SbcC